MKPRYAGFWVRTLASICDFVIVFTLSWAVEIAVLWGIYWPLHALGQIHSDFDDFVDASFLQGVIVAIYLGLSALYFITAHCRSGATLGKRWMGLRVVRSGFLAELESGKVARSSSDGTSDGSVTPGQSVLRWIGYAPSMAFGAGYLMVALHPRKRSLHDLIARTEVITWPSSRRNQA